MKKLAFTILTVICASCVSIYGQETLKSANEYGKMGSVDRSLNGDARILDENGRETGKVGTMYHGEASVYDKNYKKVAKIVDTGIYSVDVYDSNDKKVGTAVLSGDDNKVRIWDEKMNMLGTIENPKSLEWKTSVAAFFQ